MVDAARLAARGRAHFLLASGLTLGVASVLAATMLARFGLERGSRAIIRIALELWLLILAAGGRTWARILYGVLGALGVLGMLLVAAGAIMGSDPLAAALGIGSALSYAYLAWALLASRSVRAWIASRPRR